VETWQDQSEVYHGPVFSVWDGTVKLDDGTSAKRAVVRHQGSVAIVPVVDDTVVLVRQFRIAVGKHVLEIPAGRIEAGESAEESARRELREELGYRAGRMVAGPSYYSSVGFLDEQVHIFLAFDLEQVGSQPDKDERFEVVKMSMTDVAAGLQAGKFDDAKTVIGLRELMARRVGPPSNLTARDLYAWYSDENHKYNTLIWQFPAAIIGLNLLALDKPRFVGSWKAMLVMFLLNVVLLSCVAKHVYHQRCFTKSLRQLAHSFRVAHPELPVVEFPRNGLMALSRIPVAWVLFWSLFVLNLIYLWVILFER
jgi:ADP-ribose pyrophosphatase